MFPSDKPYREIAVAIQDRSFNADGSLFYPDTRAFFDEFAGPYIPDTDISPIWNPEFFGNAIIVNGPTWPFPTVEPRRYRFRVLNGCDSGSSSSTSTRIPGVEVWAIGNEGGFLAAPVNLTAHQRQPVAAGAGGTVRSDHRLHQRGGRQLRARQRRARRTLRWRHPRRRLRQSPTQPPPVRSCSSGWCPPSTSTTRHRPSSCNCRPSRPSRRNR